MRKVALVAVFVVLAGVYCGGSSKPAVAGAKWPADACGTLTEAEIGQFVKALPTFSAALKAGMWTPTPPKETDGPIGSLATFVEGMNVAGVDDSLKTAGSSWGAFKATLYKVFAASAALSIDGVTPEMIASMKSDTSASAKKGLKDYEAFKAACALIPEANKKMVAAHQQELQALQALGQ